MCGIAGTFAYHPDAPLVDAQALLRTREAMAQRGPDGAGLWISEDGRIGLAHRRLAILDLSDSGAQPMHSQDGLLTIVFNGEIYNYRELRLELSVKGYQFHSTSDTEVLLALWREYGEAMVHHLRGMFAFALWDSVTETLFLARDHFGIKPLYFFNDGKTLRFASQVKAIMAGGEISETPNFAGWAGFWLLGYVPDPHTVYKDVRAIPAGHWVKVSAAGNLKIRRWFDLRATLLEGENGPSRLPRRGERLSHLRGALLDSVKAHSVSDVQVGMFLSAGLDSSILLALASHGLQWPVKAVTLGFKEFQGTPIDEVPLARRTAQMLNIPQEVRTISRDDFNAHLERALEAMDQPSIDGINTYFVSLAAKESGLKVAISGLGGDELLGGYPSFDQVPRLSRWLSIFHRMPHFGTATRKGLMLALGQSVSPKLPGVVEFGSSFEGAYLLRRALFMPWEIPGLLGSIDGREGLESLRLMEELRASFDGLRRGHSRMMALEMGWYMRGQLLRDADWAGMAHGLEIRVPFVDVELFRTLAPIQASGTPFKKHDLIDLGEGVLPRDVLHRPKTGFATPVQAWAQELLGSRRDDRGLRGWARVVSNSRRQKAVSIPGQRRILFLATDGFGGIGGIARFNRDLAEAICLHPEVKEVVMVPRIMPNQPEPTPERLTLAFESSRGRLAYFLSFLKRMRQDPAYDLVICGHVNLLSLARIARGSRRVPQLLTVHGIEIWDAPKSRPVTAWLAKGPGHVAAVSRYTLERYKQWSGVPETNTTVFPNTFSSSGFHPGPKPEALLDRYGLRGRTVLLTVGRMVSLERYKGFDEILNLMPRLKAKVPGLAYVAVGDGNDRGRLMEKARNLGLDQDVIFTGYVPESEKADHYRLADAYVMPSRGEGFGIVFLEALACGIPVMGSSIDGGADALLQGKLGVLVDPSNPEQVYDGVLRTLKQSRGKVPEELATYAFPAFISRTHALLDRIWGVSSDA